MGTNCAPLVADLFLFCYERDFMLSLSEDNQSDVIEAFNSTSRYLDDLLNIDNNFFDSMVNRIYPSEGGWSGGAMVLGTLPVPGRPTILITVGQGPIALAVGAGGGGLDIFTLIYPFPSLSLSLGDGPI